MEFTPARSADKSLLGGRETGGQGGLHGGPGWAGPHMLTRPNKLEEREIIATICTGPDTGGEHTVSTPFCPERRVRTWGRELGGRCLLIQAGAGLPGNLESCRRCRARGAGECGSPQTQILSLSAFARTGCAASGSCLLSEPDFLPSVTCGGSPHACFRQPVFQNQINTQWYHQPGLGTARVPGPWILLSSSIVLR